jgi:hypothetical protein
LFPAEYSLSRSVTVVASLAAAVVAVAAVGASPAAARPAKQAHHHARTTPAPVAGTFVSVGAFRALDQTTVRAGRRVNVTVGGRRGIPADAAAVAVTVHAAKPQGDGSLTLFPAGTAAPATTNLTYARGQSTAQAAVVRLAHGAFTIVDRARTGSLRLAVDVRGYIADGTVDTSSPGLLHLLASPARALDTRHPGGFFRPDSVRTMRVAHGVPTRGVGAVAVMLTANDPAASGSLVAYAAGNDQPNVPTTRFDAHRTTTSFAWVPTHSDGSISIANTSRGATGVLLDVVGWANTGVARTAGAFQSRFPDRVASGLQLASGQTRSVRIAGQAGVPLAHVGAVLASVTASAAKRAGSLQIGNTGSTGARGAVDFAPGAKPSDLVEVPLVNGALLVHNASRGAVTVAVDVIGFVPDVTLAPPAMSISRYLGDLTEKVAHDQTVMNKDGCADGTAMGAVAHPFVLLDVGAQSVTGPELSVAHPGVSVTQTTRTVRLRYADLVTVLQSYLAAFSECANGKKTTVAIGTNNDGDYSSTDPYTPKARGSDWAGSVINLLGSETGVTLVGANDIEPDFASTQKQAQTWENAYLTAATTKTLIFNGSADGCADGFGDTNGACSKGFTQQGLYNLAHNNLGQIEAAPQVYSPSMAAQWANIDKTGGGQLRFAGALTEHALAPDTYTSANGWAALYYAVGSLTRSPQIAAASDITNG